MLTDYIKSVWWYGLLSEDEKEFRSLFDLKPKELFTMYMTIGMWYSFTCDDCSVTFIYGSGRWTVCATNKNVLNIRSKRVEQLYEHMMSKLEEL